MAEPSTATAGGIALWKIFGGLAGFAAIGAGLSTIVVMCMMTPRNPREWAVGLISTVIGSVCGGAAVVQYFGLQPWSHSFTGMVALLGLVFACGLPGWAVVRGVFTWLEKHKDSDIGQMASDARADAAKVIGP